MSDEKKCGCGCGCEGTEEVKHDGCGCEDHEVLTVALEDEEGNSIICEIVDGFVFENNEYALVQNPEDDSVYLFKVVGDDEIGELVVPEDDEYNAARAYYENEVASQN
ncbi:DUF1292 domain-containing protein [Clostridium ihumii]|uniref:DUF1292 domain-containing protein n=1 Tax=Clostridium ihumii TaxID=1470356 RepID=UPI003D338F58